MARTEDKVKEDKTYRKRGPEADALNKKKV